MQRRNSRTKTTSAGRASRRMLFEVERDRIRISAGQSIEIAFKTIYRLLRKVIFILILISGCNPSVRQIGCAVRKALGQSNLEQIHNQQKEGARVPSGRNEGQ